MHLMYYCFLVVACPSLRKISHVLVIHGESGDMSDYLKVVQIEAISFEFFVLLHYGILI